MVFSHIQRMIKQNRKSQITCKVWENALPYRKKGTKWYVTYEEYPDIIYPNFCAGFFFLMTNDVITVLHNKINYTRFLWLDDVWLTGLAVNQTNLKLKSRKDAIVEQDLVVQRFTDYKKSKKTLGGHMGNKVKHMKNLWQKFYQLQNKNKFQKNLFTNNIFYYFLFIYFTFYFRNLISFNFKHFKYLSLKFVKKILFR